MPAKAFSLFNEVPAELEEFFEAYCRDIVQSFAELNPDHAIEFPPIDSSGRSILHKVANYFGLASHTKGSKGKAKAKAVLVYPKTMFLEKQESERKKQLKEIEKMKAKLQVTSGMKPLKEGEKYHVTWREQQLRELVSEKEKGASVIKLTDKTMEDFKELFDKINLEAEKGLADQEKQI